MPSIGENFARTTRSNRRYDPLNTFDFAKKRSSDRFFYLLNLKNNKS
jgi:hypothetical protein